MKRMALTCELVVNIFIVLTLFVTFSAAENKLQFENGNVNVSWNYLSASQEIEFEVQAKALGYVAMGLTKTNSGMQSLDLFAGGVDSSGTSYLEDYYATGRGTPTPDSKNNYTLISATEANGVTTVRCKRKLDTQDDKDQLIQPGDQLYLAWAYHTSSDTLTTHSSRGYGQMLVLVPAMNTPMPSPTAVVTTSIGTISTDFTSETPLTNAATKLMTTASSILTSSPTTPTTSSSSTSTTSSSSSASISSATTPSTQMTATTTATATTSLSLYTSTSSSTTSISSSSSLTSTSKPSTQMNPTTTATSTDTTTTTTVETSQTITTSTITSTYFSSTNTNMQREATTAAATSQTPTPSATVSPTPNLSNIIYSNDRSFNNGNVLVHWKFDSNTNELFFKLVVKAAGWVGLGISNTNSDMKDMDVVVAGVSGGQGYIGDYYSKSEMEPPRDAKQDYILRTATESGGKTTVDFKRKINTGDDKDIQIVPGESYYIAWAYRISSDSFSYHSQRGYSAEKVVLADKSTTQTTLSTKVASAVMSRVSVMVIILSLVCTLIVH